MSYKVTFMVTVDVDSVDECDCGEAEKHAINKALYNLTNILQPHINPVRITGVARDPYSQECLVFETS
jgi:hypothetical protein